MATLIQISNSYHYNLFLYILVLAYKIIGYTDYLKQNKMTKQIG